MAQACAYVADRRFVRVEIAEPPREPAAVRVRIADPALHLGSAKRVREGPFKALAPGRHHVRRFVVHDRTRRAAPPMRVAHMCEDIWQDIFDELAQLRRFVKAGGKGRIARGSFRVADVHIDLAKGEDGRPVDPDVVLPL